MINFALLFLIINLIFFAAVAYYFINIKKVMQEEKKEDLEEKKLFEQVIEKDEQRIKDELSDVHQKATLILSQSEKIAEELIDELEKVLGKKGSEQQVDLPAGNDFELELGGLSHRLKNHYVAKIKNLLSTLEKFEYQKAQEVQSFAEEQQVTTDVNLQKIRVEELEKMRNRIERYKKEELLLFDKKVKEVIDGAALEVLGHLLTSQEQEELIVKALEKAKKEGVI